MACNVRNEQLQAIYDLVAAYVANPDLDINNYDQVVAQFAKDFPDITPRQIAEAIAPTSAINKDAMVADIEGAKERLRELQSSVNELESILTGVDASKTKVPPLDDVRKINKIIDSIRKLSGIDILIPPEAFGDIVSAIEEIPILHESYYSLFGTEGGVSKDHIESAIKRLNDIKRKAKINEIDGKIKELDQQIKDLEAGNISFANVDNLDTSVKIKGLDREIADKERELGKKRVELDIAMNKARRKTRAEAGILGFKNKGTQTIAEYAMLFKDSIWEPWRALKFMADISAWGVQAAPVVYSMLSDVNVKKAFQGDFRGAFASQKLLAKTFYETTFQIIADGAKNATLFESKSSYAQQLLNGIKKSKAFPMAQAAKLHISESRSLSSSEEVFTSNVLNSLPGFGVIKDISEDTMVSTLNALRMAKFEAFYEATGGQASLEQYQRVAELINMMTGTTSNPSLAKLSGGLSYILSAPKLFLSRLRLFTTYTPTVLKGINVKGVLSGNPEYMFQTEADRFIFQEYMKMVRGYVMTTFLVSLLAGVDFEDDPTESNFLRYRAGDLAIDATGGVGTLYRTMLKAYYLMVGVPEGASYSTKDKYQYMKSVRREDHIDALMDGFVRYKLHPTITAIGQSITGRDFFGESFELLGREGVAPHIEGMARAILPISIEQAVDDSIDLYNGDRELGTVMAASSLQFIGFNTFEYDEGLQDVKIEQYFNEVEHRPRTRYPKILQKPEGDRTKEYYRDKYRKMWSDALAEMILSRGADKEKINKNQLNSLNRQAIKEANRQFMERYGEDVKEKYGKK